MKVEGGRDVSGGESAAMLASDGLQLGQKLVLVQGPRVGVETAVAVAPAPSENLGQSLGLFVV